MSTSDDINHLATVAVSGTDTERRLAVSVLVAKLRQAVLREACWREQLEFAHVEIERSEKERDAMKLPPGERYVLRVVKP